MDGAFKWLSDIAYWLAAFIPKWQMVEPTHRGVLYVSRWTRADTWRWWACWRLDTCIDSKVLQPGTHFYWPVRSKLLNHPVIRQTADLREQTFTTTDDRPVTVGAAGVITYEIVDILKAMVETYNVDTNVVDIALTSIHTVCCRYSWVELKAIEVSGRLDELLRQESQKALKPYGVRVFKLNLTDLATTRNIKLSNSNFLVN